MNGAKMKQAKVAHRERRLNNVLSIFLTLCLVFEMMPVPKIAYAADEQDTPPVEQVMTEPDDNATVDETTGGVQAETSGEVDEQDNSEAADEEQPDIDGVIAEGDASDTSDTSDTTNVQDEETQAEPTDQETPADENSQDPLVLVSRGEGGVIAVNFQGEAATNSDIAMELLSEQASSDEVAQIDELLSLASSSTRDATGERHPSSSAELDRISAGVTQSTDAADGNSIDRFSVAWVTKDAIEDGDSSLLSLQPGGTNRSDAAQIVTVGVSYALSGEHEYAPGEFQLYVPATLFRTRDGEPAGSVVIPYPEAPKKTDAFNWQLVSEPDGDYYIISNTMEMKPASSGLIQIQWVNLNPHEIADAFSSVYDDNRANGYNEGASSDTGENHTEPWYAYLTVRTGAGNTMRAVTSEVTALMDTSAVAGAAYKRVATDYPKAVPARDLPADKIPEQYSNETSFVVVDWYIYTHYKANQPFTLDLTDTILAEKDGIYEGGVLSSKLEKPGFVYQVSAGTDAQYSDDATSVTVSSTSSGWPGKDSGDTRYVHVWTAYPSSQFVPDTEYILNNEAACKLTPIDGKDDPTVAVARQSVAYTWLPADLWGSGSGTPRVSLGMWGNDGALDLQNYSERDMVSHDPQKPSRTISREGVYTGNYTSWYGIYDDVLNQLRDGKEPTLWYTAKTTGYVMPQTLKVPTEETGVRPDPNNANGWFQWAKWDEETSRYVLADNVGADWINHATYNPTSKSYSVDTTKTDGYGLVPYSFIQSNYLQRPVTFVTTEQGLHLEGTSADSYHTITGGYDLVGGSDYVYETVEVGKPHIGGVQTANLGVGEYDPQLFPKGPIEYVEDHDDSNIPPITIDAEVDGVWQEGWATVDWSNGTPKTTYADGRVEQSAMVELPEGTANIRSSATTQTSYLIYSLYPGIRLLPDGQANMRAIADAKFTDSAGNKVFKPVSRMWNTARVDIYQWDNDGTTMDASKPVLSAYRCGDNRINGYNTDVSVIPSKEAEFDQVADVDYEKRVVTVHYTIKVEERTHVPDRATYEKAIKDGTIATESHGTWYDLLPEGMIPVRESISLRDGDTITKVTFDQTKDWRGTGRHMLIVEADLTPTPTEYKDHEDDATGFWEDVPTLTFDATMDLDTWIDVGGDPAQAETGIISHNVAAFEADPEVTSQGTFKDYEWELDGIDQENARNVVTRDSSFSEDEIAAFESLDPDNKNPRFVYAERDTTIAFPSAALAALTKGVRVNDETNWTKGTYDDERDVFEGGRYAYRLRTVNDAVTKSKGIILYDSLEAFYAGKGNDEADVDAPRWRGTFSSLDLSQIESLGCAPVVYYSTIDELALSDPDHPRRAHDTNLDLTDTSVWSTTPPADLSDVHAIAIDCSKMTDGSDFVLEEGGTLTAVINMRAPSGTDQWDDYAPIASMYPDGGSARSYIEADAHAYNSVCMLVISTQGDVPFTEVTPRQFVRFDYTKVGLKEYEIPVTKMWDDDNNRDGGRPDQVEVTLIANGVPASEAGLVTDDTLTLTKAEDWKGTFEHIPYTDAEGNTVTYRVAEMPSQVPEGYTAKTSGNQFDGFTILNTHVPERTSIEGTKTWENDGGDSSARPNHIDVMLYGNGTYLATKRIEPEEVVITEATDTEPAVTMQVWPTYVFDNLYKYEDGKEINYTVREVVSVGAYTSAVDGLDVINTYHPFGDVTITKRVSGATAKAAEKTFDFTVTLETPLYGEDGSAMTDDEGNALFEPLQGSYNWESSAGSTGVVSDGGTLTLKADETITIKDLPHGARVTLTESEYPGFTASSGGVVSTTVSQNATRRMSVNNIYKAEGRANVVASKTLEGTALKNGKFTFELTDPEGNVVTTATNRADGTVLFSLPAYTAADDGQTYEYTIREQIPVTAVNADGITYADATPEQRAAGGFTRDGLTFDHTTRAVTVKVRDLSGTGVLDVQVAYPGSTAPFVNAYHAEGEVAVSAGKSLVGRDLTADEFSFVLEAAGGVDAEGADVAVADVPMPPAATTTNDEHGVVAFGAIPLDESDAGCTYYYVAHEAAGNDGTVVYDDAAFGYKVVATDDGFGHMMADLTFVEVTKGENDGWAIGEETDRAPVFVNTLKPGGLSIEKTITGEGADQSQPFTFHVRLTGDDVDPNATYPYELEQVNSNGAAGGAGNAGSAIPNPLHLFVNLFAPTKAYAAPIKDWTDNASDGSGGPNIQWMIEEDGTLVLRAKNGTTAELSCRYPDPSNTSRWKFYGWQNDKNLWKRVTSVRVQEGHTIVVRDGTGAFGGDGLESNYTSFDSSGFDVSEATSLKCFFYGAKKLNEVNLSGWNTSNVTSMRSMFYSCSSLESLDLSGWNTANVEDMQYMFQYCTALKSLDLSGWNTSSVNTVYQLFCNCSSLESVNLSGWNTENVENMRGMFYGCSALQRVDGLRDLNTAHATNTSNMFNGCSSLTSLDLSGWDTSSSTDMTSLFRHCTSLEYLDISSFTVREDCAMRANMFDDCPVLKTVKLGDGFRFVTSTGRCELPTPTGPLYTGKWVRVADDGVTVTSNAYTPEELSEQWEPSLMGTWVWEKAPLEVRFLANGGDGAMAAMPVETESITLPPVSFTSEMGTFVGWAANDASQTLLDDQANADLIMIGDNVALVPAGTDGTQGSCVFVPQDDGTYVATLKALWNFTKYQVSFQLDPDDVAAGASGSMAGAVVEDTQDYTLPTPKFYWFKHEVNGWDYTATAPDGTETTGHLSLGDTISAGTFAAGTRVTFSPTWEEVDTNAHSVNGEFTITLHGGERAIIEDCIPAGAAYEVWEDTPEGWKLIARSGQNGTIKPCETSRASFTNEAKETPEVETKVTLEATKLLQNQEGQSQGLTAGQFRFELYEGAYAEDKAPLQTAFNDADGKVTFSEVSITEAGTKTFTIVEVKGTDSSVEYATNAVTVTVEVAQGTGEDGKPTLVAAAPIYDPTEPTFVNTLIPEEEPVTRTLTVTKVAEGLTEGQAAVPEFAFEVTLFDAFGLPLTAGTEITVGGQSAAVGSGGKVPIAITGSGSVEIGGLPDGTSFRVAETSAPKGWALVTSDGTTGTLTEDAQATFTNAYAARDLVTLRVSKMLEGAELAEGQFSFALYADEACTEQLQTKTNAPVDRIQTVLDDGGNAIDNPHRGKAYVSFDPITLTAPGTYVYYIREVVGDDAAIEYDARTIAATVIATDNGDGTLSTEVSYSPDDATFSNVKRPGALSVTKRLVGAGVNRSDATFPITVTLVGTDGASLTGSFPWTSDRAGVAGGNVASGDTLDIHVDETITITGLPEGASYVLEEGDVEGYTLDEATGTEGAIVAAETSAATFTNSFIPATAVTLGATKELKGGTLEADAFTFQLKDAEGNVLCEARNDADGKVTFDELTYAFADAGKTFSYTISEVSGNRTGVTYDDSVCDVEVTVAVDEDAGTLVATPSYSKGGITGVPVFVNTYQAQGTWQAEVSKTLDGVAPEAGLFSFTLERPNGAPLSRADEHATLSATNDADGKVTFDEIAYSQADVGRTYTYIVSEVDGGQEGIAYDAHVCRFDVTVADNGDGTLSVEGKPYTEGSSAFVNKTVAPATGEVIVEKALAGREWHDGDEFTFTITADSVNPDKAAVPRDASGEPVTQVSVSANSADHTVSFGKISFGREGSYRYVVREVAGELPGVTYDSAVYKVTINVVDDGNGQLVAREDSSLVQVVTVENPYSAAGSFAIGATKVVDRAELEAGQFSFTCVEVDEDGKPVDGVEQVSAENAADGTVAFPEVSLTQSDFAGVETAADGSRTMTRRYAVSEVVPEGAVKQDDGSWIMDVKAEDGSVVGHWTYDGTTHVVTVTATDDGLGSITCAIDKDASQVVFNNAYEPTSPTPPSPTPTPDQPDKPTTPTQTGGRQGGKMPQTGDLVAPVALLAAVGAGVTAVGVAARRRRRNDNEV